jgi:hypothetical protein
MVVLTIPSKKASRDFVSLISSFAWLQKESSMSDNDRNRNVLSIIFTPRDIGLALS